MIEHREAQSKARTGPSSLRYSFDRIILKFPLINKAFNSIKEVFDRFDVDNSGTIDKSELNNCMRALGAHISPEESDEMFRYAQVVTRTRAGNPQATESLTFKEFLLCLAIGSVLQLFPLIRTHTDIDMRAVLQSVASSSSIRSTQKDDAPDASETCVTPTSAHASVQKLDSKFINPVASTDSHRSIQEVEEEYDSQEKIAQEGAELVKGLKLVIEAWILFDKDGSGYIDREEVLAMIDEENMRIRERRASATVDAEGEDGRRLTRHGSANSSTSSLSSSFIRRRGIFENAFGRDTNKPVKSTSYFLSRERWEELHCDSKGRIGFREFLIAFMKWVGMEEEDDDSDDDTKKSPVNTSHSARSVRTSSFLGPLFNRNESPAKTKSKDYIATPSKDNKVVPI